MKKSMKLFSSLFLVLTLSASVYSQSDEVYTAESNNRINITGFWETPEPKPGISGTVYLYDKWTIPAKISTYSKNISLNNVNFNVQSNKFEVRYSKDSVLVLNTTDVKKIEIGTDVFRRFRDGANYKFYQEIGSIDDRVLVKGYKLFVKKGKINPLTNNQETADKYMKNEKFYVVDIKKSTVKEVKLKKATIVDFVGKDKSSQIKGFMEKNNLSYKNARDLKKLIINAETL